MKILRHNLAIRFVHWTTALSIFILIFTGFGQMPVYRRYNVDQIPGLGWSSDFLITLNIHYVAAIVLIFISIYYLAYIIGTRRFDILPRRGDVKESMQIFASMVGLAEEPDNSKYLAEQRLAFAVTAFSVLMLIIIRFRAAAQAAFIPLHHIEYGHRQDTRPLCGWNHTRADRLHPGR
jgi:cytochrome b subunit of formate dehydrogenase